jgi:hypothetical protein
MAIEQWRCKEDSSQNHSAEHEQTGIPVLSAGIHRHPSAVSCSVKMNETERAPVKKDKNPQRRA